jgi:predicted ATPase
LLAKSFTSPQDRALFAALLSLVNDGRYPELNLTPQQRRQRTFEALTAQIVSLAEQSPVLMIFEDIHWIDPTSLEALGRGVDRIKGVGVLLIITHRPEFEVPWIGRPYVTVLTLNRLGEHEVATIIDRVTGNKLLPAIVRQDIIERTDGIPLFVEEMTRAVLEAGKEDEARSTAAAVPSSALAVPASLHASLMARLDRLGSAKEVAQIGAVIGREFSHALLAAVVRKTEAALHSALDRLTKAGLLFQQGTRPHATYLFKHALVQDAAYGTLLREPRRGLHARIAETLETQFKEFSESQPELLARHYTEAGLVEKAADYWGKAGRRSLERSALVEAAEQFARALDQIATLQPTPASRREQITLQVAALTPLMYIKGFAAPEAKAAADRARLLIQQAEALGEPPEDPLMLFWVFYGLWVGNLVAFHGRVVRELATQFLDLAQQQEITPPLLMAYRMMGMSLFCTGDLVDGRSYLDRAIALYAPAEHRWLATRFGQDVRVVTLTYRSLALWVLGHPDAALKDAMQAVKDAREIGQAVTLMHALGMPTWTHIICGNYAEAAAHEREVVALADEKDALFWRAQATFSRGWLLAVTNKDLRSIQLMVDGITAMRSLRATLFTPSHLSVLASAKAEHGDFDDARRCINEALTTVELTGETWAEAEVHRVAGEIFLLVDTAKAETYFDRALAVARQQQAKSWELRAAMSMARLWRDQRKPQQARELLAPVYGWFTEGFDTPDLKEAKALLDALA